MLIYFDENLLYFTYVDATLAILELRIPVGDRPLCTEIDQTKADGLKELVDLMNRCWDQEPAKRPNFKRMCSVQWRAFHAHCLTFLHVSVKLLIMEAQFSKCLLKVHHGFVSECLEVTEVVFSKHEDGIHDAVGRVKKTMVQLNKSFQ